MIARIWRGVTPAHYADEYYYYLLSTGITEYKNTEGNKGVYVLRKISSGQAEFILISLWDSFDSIRKFAGDDFEQSIFYPEDDRYLIEKDLRVSHYEVLGVNEEK